jgi:DNA replication protein DnaC
MITASHLTPQQIREARELESRRAVLEETNRLRRELEGDTPEPDVVAAIDALTPDNLPDESELDARRKARAMEKRQDERLRRLRDADLPDRQARKAQAGEVAVNGKFGEILNKGIAKLGKGVIMALIGGRGSGKTQLAVCMADAAIAAGRSARYLTAFDFFLLIRETYRKDAKKSEREIIAELAGPALLILDELQERGETPWEDRLLTALIDRRYRDGGDTILIANQKADEFRAALGASIEDRLREGGGIAELDGQSRRKSQ